ncbi:MAG: four helix bundle protein [Planctomycetota bacterium]|nr:four helix bundle protein [Planctomycetota bacterium]
MKQRTKTFAVCVAKFVETLPRSRAADHFGHQLVRAGTSVGANYRSARRARSNADFLYKLGLAEEEADESAYWLELLAEVGVVSADLIRELHAEADQLTRIFVASAKTARQRGK